MTKNELSPIDAALAYYRDGIHVIPAKQRFDGWVATRREFHERRPTEEELAAEFAEGATGVTAKTGPASGGLVAVRLAVREANDLADLTPDDCEPLLPPTDSEVTGPERIWLYRVAPTLACTSRRYVDDSDPDSPVTLVELLGDGEIVTLPPTALNRKELRWSGSSGIGQAARVDERLLQEGVARHAAITLLARHVSESADGRRRMGQALAIALRRAGWHPEAIRAVVGDILFVGTNGEDDSDEAEALVEASLARFDAAPDPLGWPTLEKIVGDGVVRLARDWLGVRAGAPTWSWLESRGADELGDSDEPDDLVKGMLPAGGMAAIGAPAASFKTFLALDLALCVATGRPWLGRPSRPGAVVFVAGEGVRRLPQRVRAWEAANGCAAPGRLRFIDQAIQLANPAHVEELLLSVKRMEEPPTLFIFDTLARMATGLDENSSRDMGILVDAAERVRRVTGAAILFLHHTARNAGHLRGSTALEGALDTILAMKRDDDEVTVTAAKLKDADPFQPIRLRKRVVNLGNGRSSVVLEPDDGDDGLSANERRLVQALSAFGADGVASGPWLRACREAEISRATYFRARKRLIEIGAVTETNVDGEPIYRVPDRTTAG